jgi:hypothetical protein
MVRELDILLHTSADELYVFRRLCIDIIDLDLRMGGMICKHLIDASSPNLRLYVINLRVSPFSAAKEETQVNKLTIINIYIIGKVFEQIYECFFYNDKKEIKFATGLKI